MEFILGNAGLLISNSIKIFSCVGSGCNVSRGDAGSGTIFRRVFARSAAADLRGNVHISELSDSSVCSADTLFACKYWLQFFGKG